MVTSVCPAQRTALARREGHVIRIRGSALRQAECAPAMKLTVIASEGLVFSTSWTTVQQLPIMLLR